MAGLTVAQISEFSLILIALGVKMGHLPQEVLSFVTMIGLVTIAGSAYMIIHAEKIYSYLSGYLSIFERRKIEEKKLHIKVYDYILFGYNRIGFSVLKSFEKISKNCLVVDFNPDTIKNLRLKKVECIYGDMEDVEFLNELNVEKAKLVVSTVPDTETNLLLLNSIREKNKEIVVIVTARQISDAFELYKAGADYVIMPHFLGGEYTSKIIEKTKDNKKEYELEKRKQIRQLKERLAEGHEHPKIEKHN